MADDYTRITWLAKITVITLSHVNLLKVAGGNPIDPRPSIHTPGSQSNVRGRVQTVKHPLPVLRYFMTEFHQYLLAGRLGNEFLE